MVKNFENKLIDQKCFTLEDQMHFAKFSGDYNPIHIDVEYARKTIAGQCIIHGINGLMWALNSFVAATGLVPSKIKVKFIKPIYLNENVTCYWNEISKQLNISSGDIFLTVMTLTFGELPIPVDGYLSNKTALLTPRFIDKKNWLEFGVEEIYFHGEKDMAREVYPNLVLAYSAQMVTEIAMISEVVGMHHPGMNSLILAANLNLDVRLKQSFFKVKKVDDRFDLLTLQINSPNISSDVDCFLTPEGSKKPSFEKLNESIDSEKFSNINAMIIGGSRGLGEATARLIGAGGGNVTLTYSSGFREAVNIQNDFLAHGKTCNISKVTVPEDIDSLEINRIFNQVYYFPTPKIFGKRSSLFDEKIYDQFRKIYVYGFSDLLSLLIRSKFKGSVYYPSTIAIENPKPELAEYIEAKKEGEFLCNKFNGKNNINIVTTRLPRVDTDQTKSLIKVSSADPIVIMTDVIKTMSLLTINNLS
jgi:hypothetical protein